MVESETGGETWDIIEMSRIHRELLDMYNEKHGTYVRPAFIKPILSGRVNSKYVAKEGVIEQPKLREFKKKGLGVPELRRIVKEITAEDLSDKIYININKPRARRFGYILKETGKHIKRYRYIGKPKILENIIITELDELASYTDLNYSLSSNYLLPGFYIDLSMGDSKYPIAGHLVDNVYIKFDSSAPVDKPIVKETPFGVIAYVNPVVKDWSFEESAKLFE